MQANIEVVVHLDRIIIVLTSVLIGMSAQAWWDVRWAKYWAAPIALLISIIFAYFS